MATRYSGATKARTSSADDQQHERKCQRHDQCGVRTQRRAGVVALRGRAAEVRRLAAGRFVHALAQRRDASAAAASNGRRW